LKLPAGWVFSKVKVSDNANSLLNVVGTKFYKEGASYRYDFIWIFRLSISRPLLLSPNDRRMTHVFFSDLPRTKRGYETPQGFCQSHQCRKPGSRSILFCKLLSFCCWVRPCPTLVIKCRNIVVGLCATQML